MTADSVYAALLLLFPKPFRDEYGREMLDAFHGMRRAGNRGPLRFWTFVLADTIGAAARERLEGMRWLATALFGLAVTVATAHAVTWAFHYFYHPYFEGTVIPTLPYGLALGLVLGAAIAVAQRVLFPSAERRAGRWALASAVTLPIAILFCATAIDHAIDGVLPLAAPSHPRVLDVLVLGLGRPNSWADVATQFSAMAASALIVRAFTLKPLQGSHAH